MNQAELGSTLLLGLAGLVGQGLTVHVSASLLDLIGKKGSDRMTR